MLGSGGSRLKLGLKGAQFGGLRRERALRGVNGMVNDISPAGRAAGDALAHESLQWYYELLVWVPESPVWLSELVNHRF
ncbi:hypothetical protein TorRG33x02_174910 [Trema orientale]|uniref:Uncharacterized protein n=1 Tax=Trema orientale TaxID=63057 RepID=A0A2P5EMC8_TREOI|nr:hypothetical protein TorRG33x02_174910 [Trema orientale]